MKLFPKRGKSDYQKKQKRADDMVNNLRKVKLNNEIDLEDDVEFGTAVDYQERYGHLQGETADTRVSGRDRIGRGSNRFKEASSSSSSSNNWTNTSKDRINSGPTNLNK
ncbi:MAG: hypothetical protein ACOX40_04210 [Bacilli bacterium]|jgi:hypothetical protein|nr:hypothetical protein [Acholeplasmataceae bacterium]